MPEWWDNVTGTACDWTTDTGTAATIQWTSNACTTGNWIVTDTWDNADTWGSTGTALTILRNWADAVHHEVEEKTKSPSPAAKRAEELLLRNLTEKQRADYLQDGRFYITTKKKHKYVITKARDHNVIRLNKRGKPINCLCLSIYVVKVPLGDVLLAQKLMLEDDEDGFLKKANHWAVSTARGLRAA